MENNLRIQLKQYEPRALWNAGFQIDEWRYAQGVYVYGPMDEVPQRDFKVTNNPYDPVIKERKNRYLDFSSGQMVANAGHGHPHFLGTDTNDVWQPANLNGVAAAGMTPTVERLHA